MQLHKHTHGGRRRTMETTVAPCSVPWCENHVESGRTS
jgi:hypothetical protein